MNYTVNLTNTAMQDLREIAFRIYDQSQDLDIAKRFVEELRAECHRLESFPYAGALPKDRILRSSGYRFIVYKDYLIFYLVDKSLYSVNILAIFNARMDYMRAMKRFI